MRHRCEKFQKIYTDYTGWAEIDEQSANSCDDQRKAPALHTAAFTTRRTMARHLEKHVRYCGLCG
ncbi:hypothetical protein ABWK57_13920 [Streptomyces sp. NPDC094045]|uniref:hypothetical protein n=1 Tax=unclassified Streptomyces TaxID=2593676 RepID=UPI0033915521